MFYQQYFGGAGFPWDFNQTYHAVPYFWMSAVQQGVFPMWVAQQAMGYPLLMNLQSNFFYPPFWLFPLFHHSYTLHAAVWLQCFHVFFGALGMYYFARTQGYSKPYALIAGMAYQFFGGFYSNAEHADIIRGYALLPWLLSGLVSKNKVRATLLIPLFIYLIFTGGYMGQALAALWMSAWLVLFQYIFRKDISWKITLYRYYLMGLGVLLSAVQILPVALLKNEIARAQTYTTIAHSFFTYKNFLTSFLWANTKALLPQDISMTTMFVTLPIVGMLFFLSLTRIKENKDYILAFLLAALMITGSFFYTLAAHLFSPLGLSRFPAADYRAWLAIIIIYFAVISLKDYVEAQNIHTYSKKRFFVFFCVVAFGAYLLFPVDIASLRLSLLGVCLLGFWIFLAKKRKSFLLFSGLVFLSGMSVWESDHFVWVVPHIYKEYQKDYHIDLSALPPLEFKNMLYRPARINAPPILPYGNTVAWSGYLRGNFLITDYTGGDQLRQQLAVQADPVLLRFMEQHSLALLLPDDTILSRKNIDDILKTDPLVSSSKIHIISYSNNKIDYKINLEKPQILLENEMYFPGWKSDLSNGITLSAVLAPPGLRAWRLPTGEYEMDSYFEMPYLKISLGMTLFSLGLWLLILMRLYKASQKSTALLLS